MKALDTNGDTNMQTWEQTGKTRWRYGDVIVSRRLKNNVYRWIAVFADGREFGGEFETVKAYVENLYASLQR